jgi:DNA polymerase-3 subunit delta'
MNKSHWITKGHEKAIAQIHKTYTSERFAHAYLISGISNIGKMTLAIDMAKLANCESPIKPCTSCNSCLRIDTGNHTDLVVLGNSNSNNKSSVPTIDELRQDFIGKVNRKPYESRTKVFIINSVEKMRSEQANILLKTLEEPPENVVIILLSGNSSEVLQTITSRCQNIALYPFSDFLMHSLLSEIHTTESTQNIDLIIKYARGRLGWAYRILKNPELLNNINNAEKDFNDAFVGDLNSKLKLSQYISNTYIKDKEEAYSYIDVWLECLRSIMLLKSDIARTDIKPLVLEKIEYLPLNEIVYMINQLRQGIKNIEINVSPRIQLDNFMIRLHKTVKFYSG